MNDRLQRLATRIDAQSLRERLLLLLCVVGVLVALADLFWMSPARKAHALARADYARQEQELQRLRAELLGKADQPDPMLAVRQFLSQVDQQINEVDQRIVATATQAPADVGLNRVLVQFLRRQPGLTLVRMADAERAPAGGTATAQVMPPAMPAAPVSAPAAGVVATPGTVMSPAMTRRGLELSVAGPYGELVRYVESLEQALPHLRWGPMRLNAAQQPPQLTLQVFVVGAGAP